MKKVSIRKAIEEVVSNFFEDDYNFSNNSDFNELLEEVEDIIYSLELEKIPKNYIGYLIQKNTCGVFYTHKCGYRLSKDGYTKIV